MASDAVLLEVLRDIPVASYVAAMLGSHDKIIVVAALEVLCKKIVKNTLFTLSSDCQYAHGKDPTNLCSTFSATRFIGKFIVD